METKERLFQSAISCHWLKSNCLRFLLTDRKIDASLFVALALAYNQPFISLSSAFSKDFRSNLFHFHQLLSCLKERNYSLKNCVSSSVLLIASKQEEGGSLYLCRIYCRLSQLREYFQQVDLKLDLYCNLRQQQSNLSRHDK